MDRDRRNDSGMCGRHCELEIVRRLYSRKLSGTVKALDQGDYAGRNAIRMRPIFGFPLSHSRTRSSIRSHWNNQRCIFEDRGQRFTAEPQRQSSDLVHLQNRQDDGLEIETIV